MYIIARLNYSTDTSSVSFKTFHSKCYTTKEEATLRTGVAHSVLFVYNTFDVVESVTKKKGV